MNVVNVVVFLFVLKISGWDKNSWIGWFFI